MIVASSYRQMKPQFRISMASPAATLVNIIGGSATKTQIWTRCARVRPQKPITRVNMPRKISAKKGMVSARTRDIHGYLIVPGGRLIAGIMPNLGITCSGITGNILPRQARKLSCMRTPSGTPLSRFSALSLRPCHLRLASTDGWLTPEAYPWRCVLTGKRPPHVPL